MPNDKLHPFFVDLQALAVKYNLGAYAATIIVGNEETNEAMFLAAGGMKLDRESEMTPHALTRMFACLEEIERGFRGEVNPTPPSMLN
jgi:hypothetical protein